MPKYKREQDTVERLEEENRQLKSLNRSLQKRLKKVAKGYNKFLLQDNEEGMLEAFNKIEKELEKICWDCGLGKLVRIEVHGRYFRKCDNCSKRTKTKLIKQHD